VTLVSRSISSPALGGNQGSQEARVSADGAFVVFDSAATDLVYGQSGIGTSNVYLFDRAADTLALVSGSGGSGLVSGNHHSVTPEVSADSSVVAYSTFATDLVPGAVDRNGIVDVALYDRGTAATTLASRHAPGQASATPSADSSLLSASADGRYAVFLSASVNAVPGLVDRSTGKDIFLADRVAGTTTLVSHAAGLPATTGDGESVAAAISADGAWVAFISRSTDLVPGQEDSNLDYFNFDDRPGLDVFLYNRATGATTLVSHIPGSSTTAGDETCIPGLGISADGRYVTFVAMASNLVPGQVDANLLDVFLYDRVADTTMLVSRKAGTPSQTANGDSNGPVISGDGRWVAFVSLATDLVAGSTDTNALYDTFLFDRTSGQTLLVSRAAGTAATAASGLSLNPALSSDGRYVAFASSSNNLVPGQNGPPLFTNVFLFDRVTGVVELISRAAGTPATMVAGAGSPSVSDDGRSVVFLSTGANLIPGQTMAVGPSKLNVFVHDRVTRETELISRSALSPVRTSNGDAEKPVLTPDGRYVAFVSQATDLASGATGHDVYLADRQLRTLERMAEGPGPYYDGFYMSNLPLLSADGSVLLFTSGALALVPGDFNGANDVFARVRGAAGTGDFFTAPPCRLLDTREAGQGPALVNGVPAVVDVHGVCGVPSSARAVAVNVTVLQAQGPGRLTLHPGNLSTPTTSTINFQPGQTLANNALLALASNGEGTLGILPVVTGGGTVHVIVDISGWFE
jgi:Tol biopolymer transport system component